MRVFLAALLFASTAAPAAEPIALVIAPVPGRIAESEEDWAQMVPIAAISDNNGYCDSPEFHGQAISRDGRYAYQMVCRWVVSDLIVKVDLQTGERRGIGAGNSIAIIRNGPYEGDLIVERHEYLGGEEGGSINPAYVLTPDGEDVLMVPGSDVDEAPEAVARWLARNRWNAW